MLRNWVKKAERSGRPIAIRPTVPSLAHDNAPAFMPVSLPATPTESAIRIEVRSRGRSVSIQWPASAAGECAHLLREMIR